MLTFLPVPLSRSLLVLLKEKAGLTYKEISGFDIFGDLKLGSPGRIYKNMKSR
jgi:hypothetical protein